MQQQTREIHSIPPILSPFVSQYPPRDTNTSPQTKTSKELTKKNTPTNNIPTLNLQDNNYIQKTSEQQIQNKVIQNPSRELNLSETETNPSKETNFPFPANAIIAPVNNIPPVSTEIENSPTRENMLQCIPNSNSTENLGIMLGRSGQSSYVDITEHLNLPQSEAAKKLGVPTSTLSKRWKEAVRGRKWPYRIVCKLDKEIMTLLHNIPQNTETGDLPDDVERALGLLLRKRQEELKPVIIRL